MPPEDIINDNEELYRSLNVVNQCKLQDGKWRPSSLAFTDRNFRPSVDRANLQNNDPFRSRKSDTDGVVSLETLKVREKVFSGYKLDVIAEPVLNHATLADNPAHAEIVPDKPYQPTSHFKKVIESLAKMAEERGWLINPNS